MNQEIISKLGAPFPYEEVEAKIQITSGDKKLGMVVFYVTSRAIQSRLDEAVGALNWSNSYSTWQDKSQLCGISIFNKERNEWVAKYDGAENSNIESIKGGLTDAFKRAAVLWGIGRYLYQIDGVWVDIEQRGSSSVIKKDQQPKIKVAYEAAVKKIFDTSTGQQSSVSNTKGSTNTQSQWLANSQQGQAPAAAQPANQNADNNQQPSTPESNPRQANVTPAYDYKIHSIKPAGGGSQLLELYDTEGEITSAYVKTGEQGIAVGNYLRNVKLQEKSGQYGKYKLLDSYELAA